MEGRTHHPERGGKEKPNHLPKTLTGQKQQTGTPDSHRCKKKRAESVRKQASAKERQTRTKQQPPGTDRRVPSGFQATGRPTRSSSGPPATQEAASPAASGSVKEETQERSSTHSSVRLLQHKSGEPQEKAQQVRPHRRQSVVYPHVKAARRQTHSESYGFEIGRSNMRIDEISDVSGFVADGLYIP
ncbi:hypothetical protein NDU88_003758 [Pleurodeles waltl]|uniref:Uncharacterized protein n=1 Tax=Pleurodeles waltl TaxID=8319 RepID=A0AAV7LP10_PLEWA|nr:hypothetical protein NDU88_003758 [Pleurodeles waltl]